jgi:hypothetical protein
MTDKNERPFDTLKSESARQRWELFHRAIAHAKQSNTAAMREAEALQDGGSADKNERSEPVLSIAR